MINRTLHRKMKSGPSRGLSWLNVTKVIISLTQIWIAKYPVKGATLTDQLIVTLAIFRFSKTLTTQFELAMRFLTVRTQSTMISK